MFACLPCDNFDRTLGGRAGEDIFSGRVVVVIFVVTGDVDEANADVGGRFFGDGPSLASTESCFALPKEKKDGD